MQRGTLFQSEQTDKTLFPRPAVKKYVPGTSRNEILEGLMIWAEDAGDGETEFSFDVA